MDLCVSVAMLLFLIAVVVCVSTTSSHSVRELGFVFFVGVPSALCIGMYFAPIELQQRAADAPFYMGYWLFILSSHAAGAVIRGLQMPECFFPGKFDTFLSSHHWWHFTLLCHYAIFFITRDYYAWRASHPCVA